MTFRLSLVGSLRYLSLYSSSGTVRPNGVQGFHLNYCTQGNNEQVTNLQRVAQQYKELYSRNQTAVGERETKDPKDRRIPIPVETSIRYLKSNAYKNTYGTDPVWVPYRRNFKGQHPPFRTRVTCIGDDGFLKTGNPCPICRDEYLVLHYKNVELLKQFIAPQHGGIYPTQKTNLCRTQHDVLLTAIMESMEVGLLTYDLPFRVYNYNQYNPKKALSN